MDRVVDVAPRVRLSRRPAGFPLARRLTATCRATRSWRCSPARQGEPRAALARIAAGRASRHRPRPGRPGDLFLARHSRQREGGRRHHQQPDRPRHRGHHRPHRTSSTSPAIRAAGELRQMYDWTRPRIAIPAHGEPLHLTEHAQVRPRRRACRRSSRRATAAWCGSRRARPAIIDDVPAGRLYKDGNIVIDAATGPCRSGASSPSPASSASPSPSTQDGDDRRRPGHRRHGPAGEDRATASPARISSRTSSADLLDGLSEGQAPGPRRSRERR